MSSPCISDTRKEFLFVFVHGFLGSAEGFGTFPTDMLDHITKSIKTTAPTLESPRSCDSPYHRLRRDQLDVKLYPTYETKGSYYAAAQQLCDWLLIEASSLQYKNVILCGHSMGGLLISDAYARLYKVHEENAISKEHDSISRLNADEEGESSETTVISTTTTTTTTDGKKLITATKESSSSWIAWTKQKLSNAFTYSYEPDPNAPTHDDIRVLVNIVGLITFDTPFYGLHPRVVTLTGAFKAQEIVSTELPKLKQMSVQNMIPEQIVVEPIQDIRVPVSTKWVKDQLIPLSGVNSGEDNNLTSSTSSDTKMQTELEQMTHGSHWSDWVRHAAVGRVMAATAFYTLSLASAGGVMALALNKALHHSPQFSQFQDFLTPLYESFSFKHARVQLLAREASEKKRVFFHAMYLILESTHGSNDIIHDASVSDKNKDIGQNGLETDDKTKNDQNSNTNNNSPDNVATTTAAWVTQQMTSLNLMNSSSRHFCVPPPEEVSTFFSLLPSHLPDEIDAHMNIFDRSLQGEEAYLSLLDRMRTHFHQIIEFMSQDTV